MALEFEVENTGNDAFFDNMVLGVIDKTGAEYPGEGLSVFARPGRPEPESWREAPRIPVRSGCQ